MQVEVEELVEVVGAGGCRRSCVSAALVKLDDQTWCFVRQSKYIFYVFWFVYRGGTWSVSSENGEWSFRCEKNVHEELGWGSAGFSIHYIAAQAVRSLQIVEDANEATILF